MQAALAGIRSLCDASGHTGVIFGEHDTGVVQEELFLQQLAQASARTATLAPSPAAACPLFVDAVLVDLVDVLLVHLLALLLLFGFLHDGIELVDFVKADAVLFALFGTDWCCGGVSHGCFLCVVAVGMFCFVVLWGVVEVCVATSDQYCPSHSCWTVAGTSYRTVATVVAKRRGGNTAVVSMLFSLEDKQQTISTLLL